MKTSTENTPLAWMEKAAETCFQSMKEGLKLQEEFADRWFKSVKEATGSGDWASKLEESSAKVMQEAKGNAEEAMRLMEQGARDGMTLFNKALDLGGISTPGEAQVKVQQLWQEAVATLNNNAKALIQANSKMMQSWAEMAKENVKKASAQTAKA